MNVNAFTILDRQIQNELEKLAMNTGKPKEVILREVVQTGLQSYQPTPSKSIQALLDLAAWAEEHHVVGPKDLSTNHNKYAWEE